METIGERIRKIREQVGITQIELSKTLGYDNNTLVSNWERDTKNISDRSIRKIAQALNVEFQYLKFGKKQDPFTHAEPVSQMIPLLEISHVSAGTFAALLTLDHEPNTFSIPLNFLPARCHDMPLSEIQKKYFVFTVKGDSMFPRMHEGDKLVIEKTDTFEGLKIGDMVIVINAADEIVVKKLKKKNGVYTLESINPAYPDIEIQPDSRAVGKVLGSWAQY